MLISMDKMSIWVSILVKMSNRFQSVISCDIKRKIDVVYYWLELVLHWQLPP